MFENFLVWVCFPLIWVFGLLILISACSGWSLLICGFVILMVLLVCVDLLLSSRLRGVWVV